MSEEQERHDRMEESRIQARIELQKAVQRRLEAKNWPSDWALTLAGECLLALDEAGFHVIPPFELDPVAIELGFVDPAPSDRQGDTERDSDTLGTCDRRPGPGGGVIHPMSPAPHPKMKDCTGWTPAQPSPRPPHPYY